MFVGIWMSFVKLTKFFIANWSAAPWAYFNNYRVAVDFDNAVGEGLLRSFGVTVAFSLITLGLAWVLGMAAAVALQPPFKGRSVVRTLFLVPYALPAYAGILTWNFMLQRDTGAVNHVLVDNLGLTADRPFWLIGGNALASLITVAVWKLWPFAFLTLMAYLQSIPRDVYEAASVDGATDPAVAQHHPAVTAAGQPGARAGAVPVDVQRLQYAVRAVRYRAAARR